MARRPKPITRKEREDIISLLYERKGNRHKVAKETGRSLTSISNIANAAGITPEGIDHLGLKKAREAQGRFREINRLEHLSGAFDAAAHFIEKLKTAEVNGENARALKDSITSLAIAIDKHRLESGEVTGRTETRNRRDVKDLFDGIEEKVNEELKAEKQEVGSDGSV